jgi:dipeptidyl aminopeptidase/acylaminoacyl peptidase
MEQTRTRRYLFFPPAQRKKSRLSFVFLMGIYLSICAVFLLAQAPAKRPLAADDVYRMLNIGDPQVSPDGLWIAYTVTSMDRGTDKVRSVIWMVNWEGTQNFQVTYGPDNDSSPRWSPDGRFLAFLSERPAESQSQIWLLDRRGGEARPLTNVKGAMSSYEWSPDGKRLVLVMQDTGEASAEEPDAKPKAPKPIVIDRYHFKQDIEGYLTAASRTHLYLFEVESQKLEALTGEKAYDEADPAWSPDGTQIAYLSNHAQDPDQSGTSDILIVEARAGAKPRKLLTFYGPDEQHLAWSPDGLTLSFVRDCESKLNFYPQGRLAVAPLAGGEPLVLTAGLDRSVSNPEFTPDGSALTFLVEDDRQAYLGKVPVGGGDVERLSDNSVVLGEQAIGGGHIAVAVATDSAATEIYALENGHLRKLTAHNDALLAELQLGAVEDISFKSKDGTEIHGLMVKPPSYEAGKKYPTLVWIHGGPGMQDDHALPFDLYPLQLERQFFAAHGYVVLAINYRGSSGRGAQFTKSIFADWGNKEVADLLAGVDYAVKNGIADPDRLGIGGWSYGGILTDYTIASDPRFKAAISGAGSANQLGMYGSDQYAWQYNNELGPPWRRPEVWMKVSYPFFHADRIHTPTLFVGGEKDFNVPIIGSEQMYQALRTLGVPTELVIYPGQYHLLTRPSYIHDRLERYLAWYDKYLKSPK